MKNEANHLLAEFLGWEYEEYRPGHGSWFETTNFARYVAASELKFDRDWNELMKVVDKIRNYPTINDMNEGSVSIERFEINKNSMFLNYAKRSNDKTKIGATYHAFVEGDSEASDSESFIDIVYKCCVDFVQFIKNN